MGAREFRSMAREKIQGKWGQVALITLVYVACSFGIGVAAACIPFLGSIAQAIISPVLAFGLLKQWIKFKNGEVVGYVDFFNLGFENFAMVWKVILRVALKLLVPIILVIVGSSISAAGVTMGIIMKSSIGGLVSIIGTILVIVGSIWSIPLSYKYICVLNELAYDENRSSLDIVEQSGAYMVGNRVRIFWLQLTFIGWIILASLTCYIGMFWLFPYMQIATILFYESVSGRLASKPNDAEPIVSYDDPIH